MDTGQREVDRRKKVKENGRKRKSDGSCSIIGPRFYPTQQEADRVGYRADLIEGRREAKKGRGERGLAAYANLDAQGRDSSEASQLSQEFHL